MALRLNGDVRLLHGVLIHEGPYILKYENLPDLVPVYIWTALFEVNLST